MQPTVVLLADDEVWLRDLISEALQRAKFKVLPASNAAEALQIFRETLNIDVLLTDVKMGHGQMNGFELAAAIIAEQPAIPIVIMSGLPENRELARDRGLRFLAKPFALDAVVRAIRDSIRRIPPRSEPGSRANSKTG